MIRYTAPELIDSLRRQCRLWVEELFARTERLEKRVTALESALLAERLPHDADGDKQGTEGA